jgi:hypothetical protein
VQVRRSVYVSLQFAHQFSNRAITRDRVCDGYDGPECVFPIWSGVKAAAAVGLGAVVVLGVVVSRSEKKKGVLRLVICEKGSRGTGCSPLVVRLPRVHNCVWDSLATTTEDFSRDVEVLSLILRGDAVAVLDWIKIKIL